jgi:hypothetical protein
MWQFRSRSAAHGSRFEFLGAPEQPRFAAGLAAQLRATQKPASPGDRTDTRSLRVIVRTLHLQLDIVTQYASRDCFSRSPACSTRLAELQVAADALSRHSGRGDVLLQRNSARWQHLDILTPQVTVEAATIALGSASVVPRDA